MCLLSLTLLPLTLPEALVSPLCSTLAQAHSCSPVTHGAVHAPQTLKDILGCRLSPLDCSEASCPILLGLSPLPNFTIQPPGPSVIFSYSRLNVSSGSKISLNPQTQIVSTYCLPTAMLGPWRKHQTMALSSVKEKRQTLAEVQE